MADQSDVDRRPLEPERPVEPTQSGSDRLLSAIEEAERLKRSLVDEGIKWFGSHMGVPFYAFRSVGILTILFSVSLPVFALTDHKLITAVMSAAIAGLGALAAFYRWERTWRSRTMALDSIQFLVAKWRLELARAKTFDKQSDGIAHVYAATDDLLTNYRAVLASEADSFFSSLQVPQSDKASSSAAEIRH